MNGTGAKVDRVISGIMAAKNFGLPVKVNAVIQRGVNEGEILPLARWAREVGVDLRFIEFMDVGETNGWKMEGVVTGAEILEILGTEFELSPRDPAYRGEVAVNWKHADAENEIGLICSVSAPFCKDCQRLRVSADGKLFTCLFAGQGHDVRGILRSGEGDRTISRAITAIWGAREDRYSELRGKVGLKKAEMSYLGG
jgi:cyclic pyranopterin phosphate synthase